MQSGLQADESPGEAGRYPTLDDLLREAGQYLPPGDLDIIQKAYRFAEQAHQGQMRRSGEPYIVHPLVTALGLADLRLDAAAIAAGLLHDVPEDTSVPLSAIQAQFGEEIAKLVTGVTRLTRLARPAVPGEPPAGKHGEDEAETRAANLRKMFFAMAEDIRVILIKLQDRLHNMDTLAHMPAATRPRFAQETLDIYAPLAGRMGILRIKRRLEDLAFRHLEPERYEEITAHLAAQHTTRERSITAVVSALGDELTKAGIKAEFSGRIKHAYGIYRKMRKRGVGFGEILDITAVRVIVKTISDCYRTLGIVHSIWPPIPGQFDDYIAMPKENGYQSLHTAVVGPEGKPIEIQIRTREMHWVAEYGIAAHWRYKEGGKRDAKLEETIAWLRQLIDWQQEVGGASEFVESLRSDILRDQVYVFTPKGEVIALSAGATPIDFAYRIHTEVGHRCLGAIVNQRLVPLDYQLQNGDIVEIITSTAPQAPSRDWLNPNLNYVKTAHAREKIRQWFRRQQREDNVFRGRDQLQKELAKLGLAHFGLGDIAALFKYDKVEDLLAAIACGEVNPQDVAAKLVPRRESAAQAAVEKIAAPPDGHAWTGRLIRVGDRQTCLADCCHPVPGEPIVGIRDRGGIAIHRADCPNVESAGEGAQEGALEWGATENRVYPAGIHVEAWDRPGLLRDVATVVADSRINMSAVSVQTHPDQTAIIDATLEVRDIAELSEVMSRMEALPGVTGVRRQLS